MASEVVNVWGSSELPWNDPNSTPLLDVRNAIWAQLKDDIRAIGSWGLFECWFRDEEGNALPIPPKESP